MAVTAPAIDLLPNPPLPTDPESVFDTKAGVSLTAQQAMVPQINASLNWVATQANAAEDFKNAAATSAGNAATSATNAASSATAATTNGAAQVALAAEQVGLAAHQVTLATDQAALATSNGAHQVDLAAQQVALAADQVDLAADQVALATTIKSDTAGLRDQAQIIADAAQAAVGIPSYLLKPGYVFEVNDTATGIRWGTRHKIGEAILTARDMDASYLPLSGGVYLQSAYPALFAEVGLIGSVSGDVWTQIMAPGTIGAFKTVKRGKDGVLIAQPYFLATSTYYRSTDNGATWTALSFSAGAQGGSTTSTLQSISTDGKGVWVLTAFSGVSSFYSICRSTDNGLTWVSVRNQLVTDGSWVACETDTNGTWIITGGTSSLTTMRSLDNGLTWTRVQTSVGSNAGNSVSCDKLGVWCIGTLGVIYRSADNGATWTAQANVTFNQIFSIANNGLGVWVAVGSNSGVVNMARSPDGGISWTTVSSGVTNEALWCVVTDYSGNWFVSTPSGRIIRSVNEGQTWTVLPTGTTGFLTNDTVMSLVMINSDILAFAYQAAAGNYSKMRRSNGVYPYDSATLFKLPDLRAPQGLNYLIKAKEAA